MAIVSTHQEQNGLEKPGKSGSRVDRYAQLTADKRLSLLLQPKQPLKNVEKRKLSNSKETRYRGSDGN
jgi:hypothetical protein